MGFRVHADTCFLPLPSNRLGDFNFEKLKSLGGRGFYSSYGVEHVHMGEQTFSGDFQHTCGKMHA